jgi:hypothetical protein
VDGLALVAVHLVFAAGSWAAVEVCNASQVNVRGANKAL